ncbi:LysE family translocator [Actinocatenispora rupis]|uniref:Amino acid transporter LysE n=1 Tax=Actinocatenispora rupis TaxID=519421 RepID=A0A8J3NF19_9ACTN|nr:LysE family translocator [Actinocatenispora rupis]GID14737.1 amino acid transporter LysE [Actinocatenispora rupis]
MGHLLPFLGLCVLITVTPGLDTAVVVRGVLRGGRDAGLRTAVGCAAGLFVHATLVAVGLAELLLRSATAFEVVKVTGAALLVVLGGRSLWSALRPSTSDTLAPPATTGAEAGTSGRPAALGTAATPPGADPRTGASVGPGMAVAATDSAGSDTGSGRVRGGTPFLQGLLCNLTNPKATLFFVASLPQFVPADRPAVAVPTALGLACIAVLFSLTGLSAVALAVHRVRHLLRSRRVRRIQDALLGTTLVALGVRVATE